MTKKIFLIDMFDFLVFFIVSTVILYRYITGILSKIN